ncbi:MAG: class I SAM-dependent methyltransferase [Isosphaeraceae bacterium]|nr:class I SAM-dependent methyltransferase [Isosphaeraceae bacterium]
MRALYGRHYPARYRAIATLIPDGSSVLDLCCGPGVLYSGYLRRKGVDYQGLDINPRFIARVQRLGGRGQVWDLRRDDPLPRADTVVMQASLYHFLPDPTPVVHRMLAAAREQVIIAEPIRNLTTSRNPWIAALASRQTDAGQGAEARRFNESTLDAFLGSLAIRPSRSFLIPGGREKVYVLDVRHPESAAGPA